ncbi:hypothetical protein OAB10_04155 [Candidatus Pelagibacter sp.]|nr:hypothetical protein [Candidatus Pelagibacter sp.]
MKKLLVIIVLNLVLSSYTNAQTNNEAKNKKYIYKSLDDLKTLIKKEDPSDLKELKYIRKSENKEFFATAGLGHGVKDNRKKRSAYEYDAFIFHAIYNSGFKITFLVDIDFAKNLEKAEKYAFKYAKLVGQIPSFLREGTTKFDSEYKDANLGVGTGTERGVKIIVIGKGNYRWWADFNQARFILYPSAKYQEDLILMHESAHLSIHGKITTNINWYPAVLADGKYITKYARTNRGEDVADTISFWVAVRCIENFSEKKKNKILKAIPNRIKFLDNYVRENKLSTSPMVCAMKN